jgi:DNA-binding MarR family transcriptional regulator
VLADKCHMVYTSIMKPLETPSEGAVTAAECAESIVDVVPLVMRAIQAEMRSARTRGLSVPQFRALAYIDYHPGASLSDVAEHVGLTLPSTSKMIDGLVARELVARDVCAVDRRRIALALTERGRSVLDSARRGRGAPGRGAESAAAGRHGYGDPGDGGSAPGLHVANLNVAT